MGSRALTADESQALEEMIADSEHPDLLKDKGLIDDIIGEVEIRDRISSFLWGDTMISLKRRNGYPPSVRHL